MLKLVVVAFAMVVLIIAVACLGYAVYCCVQGYFAYSADIWSKDGAMWLDLGIMSSIAASICSLTGIVLSVVLSFIEDQSQERTEP